MSHLSVVPNPSVSPLAASTNEATQTVKTFSPEQIIASAAACIAHCLKRQKPTRDGLVESMVFIANPFFQQHANDVEFQNLLASQIELLAGETIACVVVDIRSSVSATEPLLDVTIRAVSTRPKLFVVK